MSVRRETLQIARLAPKQLGDSVDLVAGFVRSRLTGDGGFANRAGDPDLYYTVFGLQALLALQQPVPADAVSAYLRRFGGGEDLDLIHLACLAGCWSMLLPPKGGSHTAGGSGFSVPDVASGFSRKILDRIETYRTSDGGYHASRDAVRGTAYHAFLSLGAYQDLGAVPPDADRIAASLAPLRAGDGAFANEPERARGSTPATAAAVTLLRHGGQAPVPELGTWLLARCREGGFFATPDAPIPDLLSTATALHALTSLHVPLDSIREACLDFVDSLWTSQGGFYGSWADDDLDCEYTFYGLLALGHLAV